MTSPGLAQKLIITDLNEGNGYTVIQLGEKQLIQNYTKILHIFKPDQYLEYLDQLEKEILIIDDPYLKHQLKHTKTQLTSLIPKYRQKRGLINIFGTGLKYLYGTMDNDDREEIEEKLEILATNDHNLIEQSSKQIRINQHFDEQLNNLTILRNEQTKLISHQYVLLNQTMIEFQTVSLKYELDHLEKIIEQIRELLLAAKLNTLTRDILTDQEINDFNITITKLENIELKVATKKTDIIFIMAIPNFSQELYKELIIQPIPNKNGKQLLLNNHNYLTKNNEIYEVTNRVKDIKYIDNQCIKNILNKETMYCLYEENPKSEIIEIGINIIITININQNVTQTCNQFPTELKGNYLIYIENCKIQLDRWYDKKLYQETIIIPNPIRKIEMLNNTDISLKELHYNHIQNTKMINELTYKQKTQNYVTYIMVIILLIIIIVLIIYLHFKCSKDKHTQISVNVPQVSAGTEVQSKSGGVMTSTTEGNRRLPFE